MSIIHCDRISFSYDGHKVLDNISFTVEQGDYLCVVGANGAGKTTIMKGILGLKKPLQGSIRFGDGLKPTEIGYLPQQSDIQKDFPASVMEVVLSGCLNKLGWRPFYGKEHKQLALDNMERMRIADLKNKSYQELSGGQQQRVLLARALCAGSKLLVLDEPVSGLDPLMSAELYKSVQEIHAKGMAVVMISHDVNQVIKEANKVLHVGKEVFFGSTEEYVNSPVGQRFMGESL